MILRIILCALLFCFFHSELNAQRRPKQNGMVKLRDMRGEVYARGRMKDGKKDGTWREYNNWDALNSRKRKLSGVVNYRMDIREGLAIYFLTNGDTASFGQLHNNVCVGQWKIYAESRNGISSIHNYDSLGNKSGWQYEYYPSGKVYLASYFYSPDHFQWVKFTEQGRVVFRICYTIVKGNNILDGDAWYYSEYQAGVYTGYKGNDTDTAAYELQQHKNGIRHGAHRLFSNGKVVFEEYYVDGYLHGHQSGRASNANGMLREVDFVNGKMDGKCLLRTPSRKLFCTSNYRNGIKDGYESYMDTTCNTLLQELWYNKGEIDSTRMLDSVGGTTYERKRLRSGESVFSIREYFANGKVKVQRYEKNGAGDSVETHYHANGQKQLQGKIREGVWDGEVKMWNEKGRLIIRTHTCNGIDTLPEQIWDDNGVKLKSGSPAYEERIKLLPNYIVRYDKNAAYNFPIFCFEQNYEWQRNLRETRKRSSQFYVSSSFPGWDRPGTAPQFQGGEPARMDYFQRNLHYPEMEFEAQVQGLVVLQFTVETDGSIVNVRTLKSASPGLDKETIRVVSAMPPWIPGRENGKPVKKDVIVGVKWMLTQE